MKAYLYIGVGGFLGAVSRLGISKIIIVNNLDFPWHTLTANILGSFLLAIILTVILRGIKIERNLQLLVTVGFISSFTTFSTFAYEIFYLFVEDEILLGISYAFCSIIIGLLSCWCGVLGGKLLVVKQEGNKG